MGKSLAILTSFVLCGWPTWLFLAFRYLLSPEGFWQNLVVYGLGAWALLGLQCVFLVVFVLAAFAIVKRT